MTEYKRAAKAGVIAGLVWGGIAGAAFALYIESSFSSLVNQISQQLISDPTFTGGLAPTDYLNTALIESVGENSIVAAGSLVTQGKEMPPNTLVMGSPAIAKRRLREDEIERIRLNANHYNELRAEYLKLG